MLKVDQGHLRWHRTIDHTDISVPEIWHNSMQTRTNVLKSLEILSVRSKLRLMSLSFLYRPCVRQYEYHLVGWVLIINAHDWCSVSVYIYQPLQAGWWSKSVGLVWESAAWRLAVLSDELGELSQWLCHMTWLHHKQCSSSSSSSYYY